MDEENRQFQKLNEILNRLIGPGGCPWDQEQTMQTLRSTVLEETCELIEAIDLNDDPNIKEELGDLLLNAIFLCKLAEKEGRFKMEEVIAHLSEKLIRRHPHVFGELTLQTADEVVDQWNKIKQGEKKGSGSILDSIPKGLPSLARAAKAIKRMKKAGFTEVPKSTSSFKTEEELGSLLLEISAAAQDLGIDPEIALRKKLTHLEHTFRHQENLK